LNQYHVIFCPKYRRKVLVGDIEKEKRKTQRYLVPHTLKTSIKNKNFRVAFNSEKLELSIVPGRIF
jgi:REP element-mobilizing transposase RayT